MGVHLDLLAGSTEVDLIMLPTQGGSQQRTFISTSREASTNAEKTLLYLEIHHCDANPNMIVNHHVGNGSARLFLVVWLMLHFSIIYSSRFTRVMQQPWCTYNDNKSKTDFHHTHFLFSKVPSLLIVSPFQKTNTGMSKEHSLCFIFFLLHIRASLEFEGCKMSYFCEAS